MTTREAITEIVVRALDGAKEQPDLSAAGKALGTSARILSETVRTALLPLALVNLGVRKFETYLRTKFADELDDATSGIPEDSLQEPPLMVAGPVMQGLTYTYESEELRTMFLALLASSMDTRKADSAHPAFADVIRQLDPAEVPILVSVLKRVNVPTAQLRVAAPDTEGFFAILNHLTPNTNEETGEPDTDRRVPSFVDNWVRLGLVTIEYGSYLTRDGAYDWVEQRPEYRDASAIHGANLSFAKGVMAVTDWGREFAKAVAIVSARERSMQPDP